MVKLYQTVSCEVVKYQALPQYNEVDTIIALKISLFLIEVCSNEYFKKLIIICLLVKAP